MTSGIFSSCPIDQITVTRGVRQRRDLGDLTPLADSIRRLGLIHPVVVDRAFYLVAGERRLAACRSLGWSSISFQYLDDMKEETRYAVELEENIKRLEISWQDRVVAVQRYHLLRAVEPGWTQEHTAAAIGITRPHVINHLMVAENLETVKGEEKFSTALGIVQRQIARAKDSALAELYGPVNNLHDHIEGPVVCADFIEWAKTYDWSPFNFIHCDFPYGIGSDTFDQGATQLGTYDDNPQIFRALLEALLYNDKLLADSCHIMFWFSMPYYRSSIKKFEHNGWRMDYFPLIWVKSDNAGIIPDPSRGPRRVYETCLFGSRGDRKIVRPKSNAYFGPSTGELHPHEKPQAMLEHFMEMFIDEHSVVLDPTAGSGSALRAARALGAHHIVGIERDPEFARLANAEFAKGTSA